VQWGDQALDVDSMDIAPFNAPASAMGRVEVTKIHEGLDVAARHFVCKLLTLPTGSRRNGTSCMGWVSQRRPFPGRLSAAGSFSKMREVSRWTVGPR
jgi:hypothetical protein